MNKIKPGSPSYISKIDFFRAVGYFPHNKQVEIHKSKARFRIVAAGARSGKSMSAGAEIAYRALFPNQRIWAVSSQYELAEKEFIWALEFLEKFYINGERILNYASLTNAQKGSRVLKFPWGSFVKTKSTEKPQTLLGEELDFIVLCEAAQIPRSVWERMLRARIGPRNGDLLATSTPFWDANLFADFYKETLRDESGEWEGWNFGVLANPTFPKSEYYKAKEELDSKVFDEQYEGKFVEKCGKLYEINDKVFIDKAAIENLPVLAGIHYQSNNPLSVVFLAVDAAKNKFYLFDEIYKENITPRTVAREIKEKVKGKRFLGIISNYWDHATTKELKEAGLPVSSNTKEKEIGKTVAYIRRLQNVGNYLKINEKTGESKLNIYRSCAYTINDLTNAKWPKKREDEEGKHEIELPLTRHLFAPLALSYPLAFLGNLQGDIYGAQNQQNQEEEERLLKCFP